MKPLPGQKELPLVIDRTRSLSEILKINSENRWSEFHKDCEETESVSEVAHKGKRLAKLFLKYDDKPTSEMWIEILRLSRELVK